MELLIDFEAGGIQNIVTDAFYKTISDPVLGGKLDDVNIIDFLKDGDLTEPYRLHVVSHVVMALTSDMLNFLYEALKCFEKRKFSVAFSLLRKPLKEHLLFLSWILADEDDFISRFEFNNHVTLNNVSKERRLEIIRKAISKLHLKGAFDEETIWNYVYSKDHKNGFEVTWQRATHLITSHKPLLKTEDYSFNFIFEDVFDDFYYEFLKHNLPYLFLYLSQISFAAFDQIYPISNKAINHHILTTMGCYEALFLDGRGMHISRMFQKTLKDVLECVHCKNPFKIKKKNAPMFYLHEQFICEECGLVSEFPLYWLLAHGNMRIIDE